MTLVGRHAERAVLREAFEKMIKSGGRVVLVEGPTGSGKTELCCDFADYARASGALVLTAAGAPTEQSMSMGVVHQLLRGLRLLDDIGERVDTWLVDAQRAGPSATSLDLDLAGAFTRILLELSERVPVVVCVDDFGHVDDGSLEALLWLGRRLGPARLLLVLTVESTCPRQPAFEAELTKQSQCSRLSVGPLSDTDVAEFLAMATAAPVPPPLAEQYLRVSGGNPTLLCGLVDDNLGCSLQDGALVGGESLRRAVSVCLHRARPEILAVAKAWAVFDQPSITVVAGLLPMGADAVADAVDVLENMGLLHHGAFRDPVIRTTVLQNIAATERAGLHLAAADVCFQEGAGPLVVAKQILAAGRPDTGWAVDALAQAAREALSMDDIDFAARSVRLALTGDVDDRQRATLIAIRVKWLWRTDPTVAARYGSYLLWALTEDLLDDADAMTIAQYLLWLGKITTAELTGVLRTDVEHGVREFAGVKATEHGAQPGDLLTYLSGTRLSDDTFVSLAVALRTLVDNDDPHAPMWCERLIRAARDRDAKSWSAVFTAISADLALRHGDMAGADRKARLALEILPAEAWGVVLGLPLAVLVAAAVATARLRDAAQWLREPVPDTMFSTRFGAEYLHARGLFELRMARPRTALDDLRKCGEIMRAGGFDSPVVVPWRHSAARCHQQLDRDAEAARMVTEQLAMAGATRPRLRGVSLALLAELCDHRKRVGRYEAAVALLERDSDRNELVRALTRLSIAHRARGDLSQAQAAASRALQIAMVCGTEMECRRQLHDRTDGVESVQHEGDQMAVLSEAQRRVARLAASGLTNREIAGMLHITISTVEQHLTRVYRRLQVARRTDLVGHVRLGRRE
ncbi:helix-turn-helix transcriptional regulator [Kibdelosporangium aridum]|uniref:Helix-turn-helix transcriptional regulator n=1 Tax=Kibdelosporangium aridum TaxID=2030 RepID=A0A428Z596_KIBAR|nr:LuxR family transcriptional regulator [Kibdelosporangium aridum]RSM81951.1 helix-turn-helix transcriptional regulator [Kibdelosporangium aridum]